MRSVPRTHRDCPTPSAPWTSCAAAETSTTRPSTARSNASSTRTDGSSQGVTPHEGDDHHPAWAYTIGLDQNYGLPELVVSNIPVENAARMINWAATRLIRGGRLDDLHENGFTWRAVHSYLLEDGLAASWDSFYDANAAMDRSFSWCRAAAVSPRVTTQTSQICPTLSRRSWSIEVPPFLPRLSFSSGL